MNREAHIGSLVRTAIITLLLLVLVSVGSPERAQAGGQTFVVNVAENATDLPDGTCDTTSCTLTDAVNAANDSPAHDTILFDPVEFAPDTGSDIVMINPLPMIDATEGITIDGEGLEVRIYGFELVQQGNGLEFFSPPGQVLRDVNVRNLTVGYFVSGIRICPGRLSATDCSYDGSNVSIENVLSEENEGFGIRVHGANLDNISISDSHMTSNGLSATSFLAAASIEDVSVTEVVASGNNTLSGHGVSFSGNFVSNVQVLNSRFENPVSGSDGIDVAGSSINDVLFSGNTVSDYFRGIALFNNLGTGTSGAELRENTVMSSKSSGIHINGDMMEVLVSGNTVTGTTGNAIEAYIDVSSDLVVRENVLTDNSAGIQIRQDAGSNNLLELNSISNNTGDGIRVLGTAGSTSISRNRLHGNAGLGIDIDPAGVTPNDPGDADTGANGLLNFPVIAGSAPQSVTGTTCAGCLVELFRSDNDPSGYGEGQEFLGDATANDSGEFAVSICGLNLAAGTKVTATATNPQGDTSEFSLNFTLPVGSAMCPTPTPTPTPTPSPTPTSSPTPTPTDTLAPTASPTVSTTPISTATPTGSPSGEASWGDSDCSGSIGARDNQALLRHVLSQTPLSQTEPCPDIGATVGDHVWGDWDCSGAISSRDNQALLREVLDQNPLSQTEPCPDIGMEFQ